MSQNWCFCCCFQARSLNWTYLKQEEQVCCFGVNAIDAMENCDCSRVFEDQGFLKNLFGRCFRVLRRIFEVYENRIVKN